jgi:amino acid transporter
MLDGAPPGAPAALKAAQPPPRAGGAGLFQLWALGVGAVISGDFFGWNFGLAAGGFGGMALATAVVAVMYVGLCFSMAELSCCLPSPLGTTAWAHRAFGPWGGLLAGLATTIEYVLTSAVVVNGVGNYLSVLLGLGPALEPLWWAAAYTGMVGLNLVGGQAVFRTQSVITVASLLVLAVFYLGAPTVWSSCYLHCALPNRTAADGQHPCAPLDGGGCPAGTQHGHLPHGLRGALASLPYAVWLFLAIEELPLAAEDARQPTVDIPRALTLGIATLTLCAGLTLSLNSGVAPGARGGGASPAPLFDGYFAVFGLEGGGGAAARLMGGLALTGLCPTLLGCVYAGGRQISALAAAGFFPTALAGGLRGAPAAAGGGAAAVLKRGRLRKLEGPAMDRWAEREVELLAGGGLRWRRAEAGGAAEIGSVAPWSEQGLHAVLIHYPWSELGAAPAGFEVVRAAGPPAAGDAHRFAAADIGQADGWLAALADARAVAPRAAAGAAGGAAPAGRGMVLGGVAGFLVEVLLYAVLPAGSPVGAALINMSVLGAMTQYLVVLTAFLALRRHESGLPRPYRSPLGVAGAVAALAVAGLTTLSLALDRVNRLALAGLLGCFGLGGLYFRLARGGTVDLHAAGPAPTAGGAAPAPNAAAPPAAEEEPNEGAGVGVCHATVRADGSAPRPEAMESSGPHPLEEEEEHEEEV